MLLLRLLLCGYVLSVVGVSSAQFYVGEGSAELFYHEKRGMSIMDRHVDCARVVLSDCNPHQPNWPHDPTVYDRF